MSVAPEAPLSVAPGWYPDPGGAGQRYWDGATWTTHIAPPPPRSQKSDARTGDWVGGVLLSLLMPLIGLVAGIVYITRGGTKRQVGLMCVCISLVVALLWLALRGAGSASGY
jgi:uncharacterized protein DUF2510